MARFLIFTVLSLVVLGIALTTMRRLKAADYAYPAPTAALGVVLIFRTAVGKFDPHPGYFLVRSLTTWETFYLWVIFLLLVAAFLVRQLFFDRLPPFFQGSLYRELVQALGLTFFVWALVVPLNWLSPIGRAAVLLFALVVAIVLVRRAISTGSRTAWVMGVLAGVFFLVSLLMVPASFWTQDVPRDAQEQTARITGHGCTANHHVNCGGNARQIKTVTVNYSVHTDKKIVTITVTCSDEATCESADTVRESRVMGQSAANNTKRPVKMNRFVGGKQVGQPITFKPSTKSDQQYGAVSHDNCVLANGDAGTELPDPAGGTLKCRPKAGHTGPDIK